MKTFRALALAALLAAAPSLALANSTTTNLGLNKPSVGADSDTWGGYLNTNADTLDALFNSSPALLVTKGGTGATTSSAAAHNLGLGTADSPTFTGLTTTGDTALGNGNADTTTITGHIAVSGTAPSASSCGTSPSVDSGSNDNRGKIVVGSGTVTSCLVTFSRTWAAQPYCTVSTFLGGSVAITIHVMSTTQLQVDFGSNFAGTGNAFTYSCL